MSSLRSALLQTTILGSHSHCIPARDVDRGAQAVGALLSPNVSLACTQLELRAMLEYGPIGAEVPGATSSSPHMAYKAHTVSPLPPLGLLFLLLFCLLPPLQPQDFALYCFNPSTSSKVWR